MRPSKRSAAALAGARGADTVRHSSPQGNTRLYALIDRRRDGRPRIVSEYVDPESARRAADLLRWSGASIEVVLVTAIEDA